jgi:hypothetical protein
MQSKKTNSREKMDLLNHNSLCSSSQADKIYLAHEVLASLEESHQEIIIRKVPNFKSLQAIQ